MSIRLSKIERQISRNDGGARASFFTGQNTIADTVLPATKRRRCKKKNIACDRNRSGLRTVHLTINL